MTILMLDKYLTLGGVATFLETLCDELLAHNHTVYLLTGADAANRKIIDEFSSMGIKMVTVPLSANRVVTAWRLIKRARQLVQNHPVGVMHSHHRLANFAGIVVKKMTGVPHLITQHVFKDDYKFIQKFWKSEPITVPSHALKNHLVHHYGFKVRDVEVIHNAINNNFQINKEKKKHLRKTLFNDSKKFYAGYIGRIYQEKGVDVLVESIPVVKEKCPNIEFRVFGDGDMRAELKERCRALGLDADKILPGSSKDVNELLSLMDLCVIPSRSESFCLFALEAMRARKPVVATRVGGIPEVVSDEETGLLVETENHKALADCIIKLHDDPDLRVGLAEKGHRRFKDEFPAEKFYCSYEKTYQQLTAKVRAGK